MHLGCHFLTTVCRIQSQNTSAFHVDCQAGHWLARAKKEMVSSRTDLAAVGVTASVTATRLECDSRIRATPSTRRRECVFIEAISTLLHQVYFYFYFQKKRRLFDYLTWLCGCADVRVSTVNALYEVPNNHKKGVERVSLCVIERKRGLRGEGPYECI